jgi:TonB-dependent starch-binding outer membrane protein SusC
MKKKKNVWLNDKICRLILLSGIFCLFSLGPLSAQNLSVKGTVTDTDTHEKLPGAYVIIKGTSVGTVTDANGSYSITLPTQGAILKFTFIGYEPVEVTVTDAQTTVDVSLKSNSNQIGEVVVVGYGTIRKSDLTGAVSSVNTEDLKTMATAGIIGALQGRVAGVNVLSASGEPGEGMQVRIRGIGTINNSDPLYVIDGFPSANMGYLQPGDVESMEILKDASATAIYGSRGANGVILIKTKSGRKNSMNVNLDAYYGISQLAKKIDMCDAAQWAKLKLEALSNAGKTPSEEDATLLNYVIANNYKGTDWQKEIFRTSAMLQNYNLSINGGSDKNMYDLGFNYAQNSGIVKNTGDKKWAFHFNNDYVLSKHIKLGTTLAYVYYDRNHDDNGYYSGTIAWALYSDPITPAWDKNTNNYGKYLYSGETNPAITIDDNANRKSFSNDFTGRGFLQIDDIYFKGLSFRSQYSMDLNFDKYKQYLFPYYIDTDKKRDQSSLYERKAETRSWVWSNYMTYNNNFGKSNINATLGMEAQESKNDYNGITVYDVPDDRDLEYIDAAKDQNSFIAKGTATDNSILSYFVRANYSYNNKYLATATWRADGSSKFLGSNRWGYFPSFSLGWNVHEESFMKPLYFLSQLKLRVGWGQVGNEASVYDYEYASSVENGYNYCFNGVTYTGSSPRVLSNKQLKWETVEQSNFAVDFGLLDNKLSGTIELFDKKTKDMIIAVPVPIYSGIAAANQNFGEMRNKGCEVSLNYNNKLSWGLNYNVGGNISFINNEVTKLASGDNYIEGASFDVIGNLTRTSQGKEIAYFYGLQTDGIFHSDGDADMYVKDGNKIQPNAKGGDVKFVDRNHDGVINDNDRTYLGSAVPKYTYGFNVALDYKGFDLKMFFQGSYGNEIVNAMYYFTHTSNVVENNVSTDMLNAWSSSNTGSNTPRVVNGDPNQNYRFSDRYVENGSYMKIKNLQVGYSLPSDLLKNLSIQSFRIYFSVDNLYTWTKYTGYDPEVSGYSYYDSGTGSNSYSPLQSGIDRANYPVSRKYTVGLNIKF